MSEEVPVIVIGGGLAGLTAGVHLAERGIFPIVLDADAHWTGGRLAGGDPDTFHYQGREWSFKGEHGVHAVWGGYENLRATLERFTHTRLIPSYGEEWVNRWDKHIRRIEAGNAVRSRWIPAPFHYLQLLFHPHIWASISPWDFLSLPGILVSIALTVGVDPIAERKAWDGLTLKEFFRGWTPNLKATFTGVGVNLLAADEDDISLAGFIAALRFYTMLRRDSWQMSYFPQDGNTSVIQPLIEAIETRGGRVLKGYTATRLERTATGWRIIADDNPHQTTRTFYAKQIVLATHGVGAQRLLNDSPDTASIASTLRFPTAVNTSTVRLWFSASPHEGTQGGMMTGDFVPDNFFWLHRLYDDAREWHTSTGGSVIELHFYAPKAWVHLPDFAFLTHATAEVYRAFPELKNSFVYGAVRRNSQTHTRFRVPTNDSLFVKTPFEGLFACGDWVGYESPSLWMERAVTTGIAAANEVLLSVGQAPYEVRQPAPPEPLVRGMAWLIGKGRKLFSLWA